MNKSILFEREVTEIREGVFENSNIISQFNDMILSALKKNSSDIHIEPFRDSYRIRFRVDGILEIVKSIDKKIGIALVSRIKILSEIDIGEKRFPQDGRFKGKYLETEIDFRVSTIPVIYGEKCVVRILDKFIEKKSLKDLGFSDRNYEILLKNIKKRSGMIIITGPTGSGKTTTLYSIINELNKEGVNILSIEDPIEYQIEGINQVQCKSEIGLNFSQVLRGFLRQDPDIILIGEIRDVETAEIALRASLTGHLVLTTLHTKDAISSIERLINFGIDRYMIAAGVTLIQSQRLVRKFDGKEFKGRIAVEETLEIDSDIKEMILKESSSFEIEEKALEKGMISLIENGKIKVKDGVTSMSEIIRECSL
ncbi:MAG: GspE/PulE family protein [Cetobacterium sp.]|uniref:GspE/PulE family protein n=1 Tax=Cetobacterium sp. TaxID=2071632 RepID=UPI002FCB8459